MFIAQGPMFFHFIEEAFIRQPGRKLMPKDSAGKCFREEGFSTSSQDQRLSGLFFFFFFFLALTSSQDKDVRVQWKRQSILEGFFGFLAYLLKSRLIPPGQHVSG
jgi:hypothetical protein